MAPVMLHLRCYVRPAPPSHCLPVRSIFPVAREQRQLAAILAADVVGYSRLMGRDESSESGAGRRVPRTRVPILHGPRQRPRSALYSQAMINTEEPNERELTAARGTNSGSPPT